MISTYRPRIGERVRVRVNAECAYCTEATNPDIVALAFAQDGRTAVVVAVGHTWCFRGCDQDKEHLAHDVWVRFDEERPSDERWLDPESPMDQHFAPQELEPIEDDNPWTCVDCLHTVVPGAHHDCQPDGSYICCDCTAIVRGADRDDHPCGPCQCHQPEG